MLELQNIHTYHGHLHVVKGLDLTLEKGEIVAVVGSNGAGKSTLLGTLAGIYPHQKGSILFQGKDMTKVPVPERVRAGICLVPERRQIFSSLPVRDNLMIGAYHRYGRDSRLLEKEMEQILELFPRLAGMLDRPGGLLSGGEQQMLAIGRGLMAKPSLLMLDEPSLGLAPLIVKDIMNILKNLCEEFGTTILLVEQNVKAALKTADRACVLERGEIVLSGASKDLMNHPKIQEAYFGKRQPNLR